MEVFVRLERHLFRTNSHLKLLFLYKPQYKVTDFRITKDGSARVNQGNIYVKLVNGMYFGGK